MNKYIIGSVVAVMSLSSCSDFLDVQPEGNPSTGNFFTNDQQAIDAIDYIYARFPQENMFGRELFWEQGAANDIVWGKTRSFPTIATFKYTGDESCISDSFNEFYKRIAYSNYVIKNLLNKENRSAIETR